MHRGRAGGPAPRRGAAPAPAAAPAARSYSPPKTAAEALARYASPALAPHRPGNENCPRTAAIAIPAVRAPPAPAGRNVRHQYVDVCDEVVTFVFPEGPRLWNYALSVFSEDERAKIRRMASGVYDCPCCSMLPCGGFKLSIEAGKYAWCPLTEKLALLQDEGE